MKDSSQGNKNQLFRLLANRNEQGEIQTASSLKYALNSSQQSPNKTQSNFDSFKKKISVSASDNQESSNVIKKDLLKSIQLPLPLDVLNMKPRQQIKQKGPSANLKKQVDPKLIRRSPSNDLSDNKKQQIIHPIKKEIQTPIKELINHGTRQINIDPTQIEYNNDYQNKKERISNSFQAMKALIEQQDSGTEEIESDKNLRSDEDMNDFQSKFAFKKKSSIQMINMNEDIKSNKQPNRVIPQITQNLFKIIPEQQKRVPSPTQQKRLFQREKLAKKTVFLDEIPDKPITTNQCQMEPENNSQNYQFEQVSSSESIDKKQFQKNPCEKSENVNNYQEQLSKNLLSGIIVVFTGLFNGISREDLEKIVTDNGGRATGSVSGKTTMLVHGYILEDQRQPEQGKKYQEAIKKKTRILSQEQFDEFLKQKLGQGLQKIISTSSVSHLSYDKYNNSKNQNESKLNPQINVPAKKGLTPINIPKFFNKLPSKNSDEISQVSSVDSHQLWFKKHQPGSLKDCIGNQKCYESIMEWLHSWDDVVLKGNKKQNKQSSFYNRIGGAGFNSSQNINSRACLLSGPPGVGKTTAVRLIAKHMGYDIREWNASDERSKKSVNSILGELKTNSILQLVRNQNRYYGSNQNKNTGSIEAKASRKYLILMDEVDGMSTGDRGGGQALIDAIKSTKIPIFCICNDRMHPKVRSLANNCYDIKFIKPQKQDLAQHLVKVCEKEGFLNVEAKAIEEIVSRMGSDIRQSLSFLEMHFKTSNRLIMQDLSCLNARSKDVAVMMEGYEASLTLLQPHKFQNLTLRERMDLFFIDYEMIPLLVQQNYLDTIQPSFKTNSSLIQITELTKLVEATASIAESDILSNQIRSNGQWPLLPNYAFLSSILPCQYVCGEKPIYPRFPEWLGKNSTTRKTMRELREFRVSISNKIFGSRFAIKFDYVPIILNTILTILSSDSVHKIDQTITFMHNYGIKPIHLKEHLNDLIYPRNDYYSQIPTQVKTSLTKNYNQRFIDDSSKASNNKQMKQGDNIKQKSTFEQISPKYDTISGDFLEFDVSESDEIDDSKK